MDISIKRTRRVLTVSTYGGPALAPTAVGDGSSLSASLVPMAQTLFPFYTHPYPLPPTPLY